MTSRTPVTPGAQRSLDRAARLAAGDGAVRVAGDHLLWALWVEECNAAAVLEGLGVTRKQLEARVVPPKTGAGPVDERPELLDELLYEARQFFPRFDPNAGELTSEHLLLALTVLDPDAVRSLGLTGQQIVDAICPPSETGVVSVDPEYQLQAAEQPVSIRNHSTHTDPSVGQARTIDAAANRTREGLRVVEDYTRFGLNDRLLTEQLKQVRHAVNSAIKPIDSEVLIRCRDTVQDVGTSITTPAESSRRSVEQVVQANMKRTEEGLRTLEEFLKLMGHADAAGSIEQLRYRCYTLEKAVLTTVRANRVLTDRTLYLLVTESLCQRDWKDVVIEALAAGVSVVQLREKSLPDDELIRRGNWLRQHTANAGALFVMNDRPDLAVRTEADGVHLGQGDGSVSSARAVLGCDKLIGVSTHSPEQLRRAVLDGADYLGVGPVFAGRTKSFAQYAGLDYVSHVTATTSLPWFAIGGIDGRNLAQVLAAGARRIAVTGAICGEQNVESAASQLTRSLRN